jgi:hypothetical protein
VAVNYAAALRYNLDEVKDSARKSENTQTGLSTAIAHDLGYATHSEHGKVLTWLSKFRLVFTTPSPDGLSAQNADMERRAKRFVQKKHQHYTHHKTLTLHGHKKKKNTKGKHSKRSYNSLKHHSASGASSTLDKRGTHGSHSHKKKEDHETLHKHRHESADKTGTGTATLNASHVDMVLDSGQTTPQMRDSGQSTSCQSPPGESDSIEAVRPPTAAHSLGGGSPHTRPAPHHDAELVWDSIVNLVDITSPAQNWLQQVALPGLGQVLLDVARAQPEDPIAFISERLKHSKPQPRTLGSILVKTELGREPANLAPVLGVVGELG